MGKSLFLLVSKSSYTGGWSKLQNGWGCQKERGSNIKGGVFIFLFYQSKPMSHFDFVPVISVSADTTLKEKYLGKS